MTVNEDVRGPVFVVTIDRPESRNAVDRATALALAAAFRRFESDDDLRAAVLTGSSGTFCSGADLKAVASGASSRAEPLREGDGPMGPTRMALSKPVIAAIEGYAVAGGLELALWCDLRVAARGATLGVFNRRWGVPLIDGGTIRLPRLVGHGRALDLILTGRAVEAEEALAIGLVDRVVEPGGALDVAVALGAELSSFPQAGMRGDRRSAYEQWGLALEEALAREAEIGREALRSPEMAEGVARFAAGEGRHGRIG